MICIQCGVQLTDQNWPQYMRKQHNLCKNCKNANQRAYRHLHRDKKKRNEYERSLRQRNPEFVKLQRLNRTLWEIKFPEKAKRSRQNDQERRENDPILRVRDRIACRKSSVQNNFKMTLKDYEDLLKQQNYKCAICGKDISQETRAFDIDHCHQTGAVRGLLCRGCNVSVGAFENKISKMKSIINYLKNNGGYQVDE